MQTAQQTFVTQANPLDLVEELVNANDWPFDRFSDSELMVTMSGHWCPYSLCFVWQADTSAMFFSCHFDQRVTSAKRAQVNDLLVTANEKLWLGHFDLFAEEGSVVFRHTVPLRGLSRVSVEQLEDLVDTAVQECERFYPALQLVLWGGYSVEQAISVALMDTLGEA